MSRTKPDDDQLVLCGIDGTTGRPLVPEMSWPELTARVGVAEAPGPGGRSFRELVMGGLRAALGRMLPTRVTLGLPDGVDAEDPRQAGWAVVVASDAPPQAHRAAERLLEHRRRFTGVPDDRSRLLDFRPGCPLRTWLSLNGFHIADVEPERLPYYVTLVGGPDAIPFEVQTALDVSYAVGRLAFDDPDGYGRYVESLIAYETGGAVPTAPEVVYWGPRHDGDPATRLSADTLVGPLHRGLEATESESGQPPVAGQRGFRSIGLIGPDATRANLAEALHGRRPAVLFTASHGLGWPRGHGSQRSGQGSLLGQEWPGPGEVPGPGDALAAVDVGADARVHGLIAFLFACYGAGTPAIDAVLRDRQGAPIAVADRDFVAALPQRLLSADGGGALAVVGHVDRAWSCSIQPGRLGARIQPFRNFLSKVLRGAPVGHATQDFSDRFRGAALLVGDTPPGRDDHGDARQLWLQQLDARNYVLLGDPAVRLRTEAMR